MSEPARLKSHNHFINENHDGLLDAMEVLESSLLDEWNQEGFLKGVQEFILLLEDHFLHEETILHGAGFTGLDSHALMHRQLALNLRKSADRVSSYKDACTHAKKARKDILQHELVNDQEYWPVLDVIPGHHEPLIRWSPELETGNPEVDSHHQSLVRHLNKFHNIFFAKASRIRAASELRSLYAYSEMHFSEEERCPEVSVNPKHMTQHKILLQDLDLLIEEVNSGEYDLGNISSHLKYWFLNHLRNFDIPAFKV